MSANPTAGWVRRLAGAPVSASLGRCVRGLLFVAGAGVDAAAAVAPRRNWGRVFAGAGVVASVSLMPAVVLGSAVAAAEPGGPSNWISSTPAENTG